MKSVSQNLPQTKARPNTDLFGRLLISQLGKIQQGYIELVMPDGEHIHLGNPEDDLQARLLVWNKDFFRSVVLGGSVGAAESWIAREWDVDDLTKLIRIFARNRNVLDKVESTTSRVLGDVLKIWHRFNRNTRSGSRKNIAAHYDLGNDLFELFLDRDWMMYSSALYYQADEPLEQAQHNKLKRLCDKLALNKDDHLLEIGTGWGGCAVFAAKHYGCQVTTTTISQEQYDWAVKRIQDEGLSEQITVLLEDYRDLKARGESYDKLISIEMVEAVGHQYLDNYFEVCSDLLKDDGLAVIQAITIEDSRYEHALNSVDFIKRYIFPGSFIPCVSVLTHSAARAGLRLSNLEDIGDSYALTLKEWRERFFNRIAEVQALGYSDEFIRMWEFYFCYCEGGFMERSISDVHLVLAKPDNHSENWRP